MTQTDHHHCLYQYHPEAARILVYFLAFQIKNLMDTILCGGGLGFIVHHAFAILSSGLLLWTTTTHFYVVFYGVCQNYPKMGMRIFL